MRTILLLLYIGLLAGTSFAATDVRVNFTLDTTDAYGAPLHQSRYYDLYRPDGIPRTRVVPMIVLMDGSNPIFFHRKADQGGFIVISASFAGNSSGTPGTGWINDDPRIVGYQDYDYITEVIKRVRVSDNAGDAFVAGLSKGGHMSLAYACVRPSMIRAAASLDEFMGLTSNIPSVPVPVMMFEGTLDTNVPYTMVKDTADAWRAVNGLSGVTPVTTFEPSPLTPGSVSQATWRGGTNGTQVAVVTIISGTHTYPLPAAQTGYDWTDGVWAFFSQFLTSTAGPLAIVSQPVNNIQPAGQPASFWVTAMGNGPLSYQWQKNGQDIPGATSNWYTTPPAAPADNGATFRAVVRNASGIVTSTSATLSVSNPPTGPTVTAPPLDQAAVAGQPVTFTVAATGRAPLRYQWKKNGINVAGATAAALAMPAAITADSGASFAAVISDSTGSTTSTRATLTVTPAKGAPIILGNPDRARVLVGQSASFSVTVWSASPVSYQWQKAAFTGSMADIPSATTSTLTIASPTLEDHLSLYHCVVSNAAGNVTSASEMLFVTAAVVPPTQITSLITFAAQTGVPFQYTVTSSGGTAPVAYSARPMPAGLALNPATGVISGTPTSAGATSIVIDAFNSSGGISAILTLTVANTAPVISLDSWRAARFGASATDPSIAGDQADPDGDGFTNFEEFMAGANPLDGKSVPGPPRHPRRGRSLESPALRRE